MSRGMETAIAVGIALAVGFTIFIVVSITLGAWILNDDETD